MNGVARVFSATSKHRIEKRHISSLAMMAKAIFLSTRFQFPSGAQAMMENEDQREAAVQRFHLIVSKEEDLVPRFAHPVPQADER